MIAFLTTTDINEVKDREYDRVIAKCHMNNWGKIYLYPDTKEPLDVEDVIDWGLESWSFMRYWKSTHQESFIFN